MPVELKLIGTIAGSAMMFHFSRSMFSKSSKVPGFDEVMMADPELKRRYQDTAAGLARKHGLQPGQPPPPTGNPGNGTGGAGLGFLGQMLGGIMGGGGGGSTVKQAPVSARPSQGLSRPPPPPPAQKAKIQAQAQAQTTNPGRQGQRVTRPNPGQSNRQERPGGHRPERPQSPTRLTRTRIPMNDPDDVDGLLSSLNPIIDQDEVDLSEIENYSDM